MKLTFFLLVFTMLSSTIQAESLRIVTEQLPPLQTAEKNGVISGAMVEIVQLLLKRTKIDGHIEILPWARSYQVALTQKNTLIFSMFRAKTREKKFQWIGRLLKIESYLVALKSTKNIHINTIKDAKAYSVGSIRSDLAENYLKKNGFEEHRNLYLNSSYSVLWPMLFNGRTDLAFTNDIFWRHEIKELNFDPSKIKLVYKIPNFASNLYLAASLQTDKKIVLRLSKALQEIKTSGEYSAILQKWKIAP